MTYCSETQQNGIGLSMNSHTKSTKKLTSPSFSPKHGEMNDLTNRDTSSGLNIVASRLSDPKNVDVISDENFFTTDQLKCTKDLNNPFNLSNESKPCPTDHFRPERECLDKNTEEDKKDTYEENPWIRSSLTDILYNDQRDDPSVYTTSSSPVGTQFADQSVFPDPKNDELLPWDEIV